MNAPIPPHRLAEDDGDVGASVMPLITHRLGTLGMIERWQGIVTAADIISMLAEQDEAKAALLRYLIVDLRRVVQFDIGSEDVYKMAHRLRLRQRQVSEHVVAIAPQDLAYGLVRMLGLTWATTSHRRGMSCEPPKRRSRGSRGRYPTSISPKGATG